MGIFTGWLARAEQLVEDTIKDCVNNGVSDADLAKEATQDLDDIWDAFAKDKKIPFIAGSIVKTLIPMGVSFGISALHSEIQALRDAINKAQTPASVPVTSFEVKSLTPTPEQLGTISHPDILPVDEHPEIPLNERIGIDGPNTPV